jgi:hypothetical protein
MILPVQKGKQVQDTQARQQVRIDLGHQLAFIDIMSPRSFRVRWLVIFWRVGERTLALLISVELCSRELSAPVSRVQSQALHGYGLNRIIPATPMIGCDRLRAVIVGGDFCQGGEKNTRRMTENRGCSAFGSSSADQPAMQG